MTEYQARQNEIKSFMKEQGLEGLLLRKASSFAWATCGAASFINRASTDGAGSLLLTPQANYVITTNIEAVRMEKEEKLADRGWTFHVLPWHSSEDPVPGLAKGLKLGADGYYPGAVDLSNEISLLRTYMSAPEQERFRDLGQLCAQAMDETIHEIKPGQTEYEIAALISEAAEKRGMQAIVNLIATDERIYQFRHPLPTEKKLDKYAMVVLCGRKAGLVCSITRLVHFGPIPAELKRKTEAVAKVDATFINATRPGRVLNEVFQEALKVYQETGFAGEWQLHHQGGPAGYEPREFIATPISKQVVKVGQPYAWNPSITGCKSEDTILVGTAKNEVLSEIKGWPVIKVVVEGKEYARPAVLEVR
jgi:Xaa-Pro aminopeptidase